MKEVKKCSISGIAFTMEADAFQVLSRYLESLNDTYRNTDGGKEIVEDIEARIAELILSHQDNSKVVELSLVEEIIAQMGSAEAIREQEGREAPRGEGRIPRRLYRDMDQARLGGVCSGVAKYFGTSPTWIRLLMFLPLILLLLLGWIPFFWWLVPLMSNLLGVFLFATRLCGSLYRQPVLRVRSSNKTDSGLPYNPSRRLRRRITMSMPMPNRSLPSRLCLGAGRPDCIETPGRLAGIRVDSGCMRIDYRSVCCRDGRSGGCVYRCGHLDGVAGDYDRVGAGAVADLCVDVPDCFPQIEPPGRPDDFPNLDIDYYRPGCFCGPGA